MCFSIEALSVTGTSKVTMTGMPTPTVSPCSGATEAKVCWSSVRSWVWKRAILVTCWPSLRVAVACTR